MSKGCTSVIILLAASLLIVSVIVAQDAALCAGTLSSQLVVGQTGRVVEGVTSLNMRDAAATTANFVLELSAGDEFTVLDGPTCDESLAWWQLQIGNFTGWTVQGNADQYWLESTDPVLRSSLHTPVCDGALPSRLINRPQGRVATGIATMFVVDEPGNFDTSFELPGGAVFDIVDVPVCFEEIVWWQIQVGDQNGWVSEGKFDYNLQPINIESITCGDSLPSRLIIGDMGRIAYGVDALRVRDDLGLDEPVLEEFGEGMSFRVTDGPICADGLVWWEVFFVDIGFPGAWIVEGNDSEYWLEPLTAASGDAAAIIVFESAASGESQLMAVDTHGNIVTGFNDPDVFEQAPVLSPDGSQIAFEINRPNGTQAVVVMNADGNDRRTILDAAELGEYFDVIDVVWSPDGSQFVMWADPDGPGVENSNLFLMNADGSDLRALTTGSIEHSRPSWSPDGTQIAVAANYDETSTNLHIIDVTSGDARKVIASNRTDGTPLWSPDGSVIAFTSFVPEAEPPASLQSFVVNADGSDLRQPTGDGLNAFGFSWSPDGSRIAFLSVRNDDSDSEIFVVHADGSDLQQLSDNDAPERSVAWSPDGTQLVFISERDAPPNASFTGDVYIMNADGSNVRRLTDNGRRNLNPVWLP